MCIILIGIFVQRIREAVTVEKRGGGRRGAGQRLERQQEPSEEEEEQVRKQYIDSKI
jgi:hypothetical protein